MGNTHTHVHERACGDCPGPSVVVSKQRVHVISSPRSVDRGEIIKACKKSTDSNSSDATTSTTATATTIDTTNTTNKELPIHSEVTPKAGVGVQKKSGSSSKGKSKSSSTTSVVLKTIKNTLQDIFDPPEPERLPPKRFPPKQLIYGCQTAEQHFDYVDAICSEAVHWHGKEGLDAMGFQFRMVHHPKNCTCPENNNIQRKQQHEDDLTDSEADDDDEEQGYMEESDNDDDDDDIGYGQFDDDSEAPPAPVSESFMVPVKEQEDFISTMVPLNDAAIQRNSIAGGGGSVASGASPYTSSVVSRNTSTASLFSLATHNTDTDFTTGATSIDDASSKRRQQQQQQQRNRRASARKSARFPLATISSQPTVAVMEPDSCALRLHHVPSGGTLVTAENHLQFIPDGTFYDELARLCMEYSQQVMMEEADLEWVTIPNPADAVQQQLQEEDGSDDDDDDEISKPTPKYGAMVSRSYMERRKQRIAANASSDDDKDQNPRRNKTLVIITGKGQVKAGIFSRRHLLVTSMEAATALPFTRGAQERDMDIVILDPNALGYRMGMDVVENSLKYLFLEDGACDDNEDIYVLAHSMAGAQLVRFFTSNSCTHSRPATPASSTSDGSTGTSVVTAAAGAASSNNNNSPADEAAIAGLLKKIRAIALTDSNHNINWTKRHPDLTQVLTGPKSLYIKSHKVHEKAKSLGERHHDCQFWRHRFGDIKTLWAGTHEHALTNYTAREHIWEHFDAFLREQQQQDIQ